MSNGWEKYLHLPQPAACRAFQRMAMLGSCQHIIASVWVSGIGSSTWDGSQFGPTIGPPFLQLLSYFCPYSSFRQDQFGVRNFDCEVGNTILPLEVLTIYWRWTLWVPSSQCWAFWLRSLPLGPESLSPPLWYFPEGPCTFPEAAYFHWFFWPSCLLPIAGIWINKIVVKIGNKGKQNSQQSNIKWQRAL